MPRDPSDKRMDNYRRRRVGDHLLHPETQMMGYGFSSKLSEGALKPPIFLTSTFVFESAQEGKDFFDFTSGRREPPEGKQPGLVYSRFNNPNLEVLEDRLGLWENAEAAAVFSSGMAAISTTCWAFLRPGDAVLHSSPLYGGTETLLDKTLPEYGIHSVGFIDGVNHGAIDAAASDAAAKATATNGRVAMILAETPANPTNTLVDLAYLKVVADRLGEQQGHRPPVVVDNTFLGPVYQTPLAEGCDLSIYSLTKYVGGHSDLVAGAVVGAAAVVKPIRALRAALGTQLDPHSAWMIMRSLETLTLRMEKASSNARLVAEFLRDHPAIEDVNYLGFLPDGAARQLLERQCANPGSTFAFYVKGGEQEAFAMLDALEVLKLAVSLGGTETLISHPASTTHSGVPAELRARQRVTDAMIRISVGIEHPDDLIADLDQALSRIVSA